MEFSPVKKGKRRRLETSKSVESRGSPPIWNIDNRRGEDIRKGNGRKTRTGVKGAHDSRERREDASIKT